MRAPSSRAYHTSYPVRVPRPAPSFHASFRLHLPVTPLRFACPSAPLPPGQGTFTPEYYGMHGTHASAQGQGLQPRLFISTQNRHGGLVPLERIVRPGTWDRSPSATVRFVSVLSASPAALRFAPFLPVRCSPSLSASPLTSRPPLVGAGSGGRIGAVRLRGRRVLLPELLNSP